MLMYIEIENFVLVEKLRIDFTTGLQVLTGETGAGKSIWIDAIELALGERADACVIRQGEDRCVISAGFNIQFIPSAQQWLIEHEFASVGEECLIQRVIPRNGRPRSSINGKPCPLHWVRDFGQHILSIHGQHQHQRLLKGEGQQQQLDRFAQHENLLRQIAQLHQQWQEREHEIAELQIRLNNRQSEMELLRYQIQELQALNLKENEWQELSELSKKLHNSQQWQQQLQQVLALINDSDQAGIINQLNYALHLLKTIKSTEDRLISITTLLSDAYIYLQEAGKELCLYVEKLETQPEKLLQIEERLDHIHEIARKHRVQPHMLSLTQQQISEKISALENGEKKLSEYREHQAQIIQQYELIASILSQQRLKAAEMLSQEVTNYMQQLGMNGGRFHITWEKNNAPIHPLGKEKIHFLISTNPGQELQPLQKVISGGELSRLHLTLQVITAQKEQIPTLIFDEVDGGIGGKTAAIVGKLLRLLGKKTQVLCITHMPQVAIYGHRHFKISKLVKGNHTHCEVRMLNDSERAEEVARMLGSELVTQQTLAYAQEMLNEVIRE